MTNLPIDRLRSLGRLKPLSAATHAVLSVLTMALMIAAVPQPEAAASEGDKPSGLEVAKDSDKAQRSDSEYNVMTMTLENSRGQQRIRTIEGYSHELSGDEEHRFAKFLEPSDVKDTTLLTYDYRDEDDDIWLYLPALKKVKRILSSNKTDYFMGSDFTYWDMENLDFINWTYALTGEETIDGVDCWIVEATPANDEEKKESGYEKTASWISKKDHLPRRVDFHDLKGRHAKRLTTADIRPTSDSDPRPRAHKLTMENYVTKHKTVLVMEKLALDVAVDEEIFSQRNMRQ
ncbi:MAG: outer membrane lipoprotein-sorting protein [Myxococcales bacterium]|nr:MAG: outer membrane lipoprotein-sorting protein [Myxococcales bacterium]